MIKTMRVAFRSKEMSIKIVASSEITYIEKYLTLQSIMYFLSILSVF